MVIEEMFTLFPKKADRLAWEMEKMGLQCTGCQAAGQETLEMGMMVHGMPEDAIDELIDRLNTVLEEETNMNTITLTETAAKKYLEILKEISPNGFMVIGSPLQFFHAFHKVLFQFTSCGQICIIDD